MNLLNLFESNDSGFQALDAWKQQVLQAHPDHAGKIKFLGRDNQVSAEVPGLDRSFGVFDLDTEQGQVLDEAYNKYHANRTGFAKPQRDLSGEGEPEGMFMVMIDGRPWKEFTSNIAFQRAKAFATKYPNKTVQVKWPNGQLNTVKEDVTEAVEDRTSYQVAKVLSDRGIKYDPAREGDLIKAIGVILVKELNMSPAQARSVINDPDFIGDTFGELQHMPDHQLDEKWSQKYKSSINCSHPKGFSQRAHCAGKKKHNESVEMEMVCEDCGMCQTHSNVNEIAQGAKDANGYTRCWPGKHAEGTKKGKNGGQVRNCKPNESQGVAEGYDPVESDYQQWEDILVKDGYRMADTSGAHALGLVVGHQLMSDPAEVASTIRNILAYVKQNRQVLGKAVSDRTTVKDAIIDIKNKFPQQYQAAQQPQDVAEAGFPGAPDVEMPPMKPSGDPQRDKLKQEYMDLHREIKSLVDIPYSSNASPEQKMQAKARIKQLNDRADQIKAILEPRQPPNEWQKKTYGYDDNWNIVKKGVAEGSDNPWGDQGNFAGDTPVNLGGVTVKRLQVGDTVRYLGQLARIDAMSKTGNTSRITIANNMGGVTKDVLTRDLKRTGLNEFAPPGGDDREPDEEHILRQLAAQWWNGTEQQMARAQRILAAMGWEIGQDESGDDDAGVFLIRAGDEHGDSYIAFNHSDLELNESKDVVHRIGLTVTDPNHPMVSKRGETIQKTVRVNGGNRDEAIKRAITHHRKKGYKVHDHHYIGTVDSPVQEEGPGPETGFGAEGSKKLGTVNTELISRAWRENRPNVVLTFGNSGEYRLDRGMIRYLLNYYKALPDDNSKWYFIYETMSRLEKLVALLDKANLPNSEIPAPGQQELDLTEKKRPKDDLSSVGARDADVQRALQRARAATPTASSDIGALVKQDLRTQEKTQQKLDDIEADNQRQMDMLKKNDSVNIDQQRAIRNLERQVSKVPGIPAIAKSEPTPAPKKSAVTPVAPAVEPARIPPMARPRPTIGNKVPAGVKIPSLKTPRNKPINLPDPAVAVQTPAIAVQEPTRLQIPAPQGQQTILPSLTPQAVPQYNKTDAVDIDFRHLGAAPNLDNFDEPEEPQKKTGTYGESIRETANNTVKFSIDGERAYDAVMDRFGHVIDWDDDSMTAPRNIWPRIEEIAHDFGGEASEEGSEFALGE